MIVSLPPSGRAGLGRNGARWPNAPVPVEMAPEAW